ncbi:MAG TPA: acyltransferase [Lacibacter sp.]|nr:acyltransferase [Lacibacter sp.]HMO90234.1 acyltransferase [Lacibacter sp.]
MPQTELVSERRITLVCRIKGALLRLKYGRCLQLKEHPIILGKLPFFKIPGSSRITLGDRVILDSDPANCNIPLLSRCKLVCGTNAIFEIGANTVLNGVGMTAYKAIRIGKNCLISSGTYIADTDLHPLDPALRQKVPLGYPTDHDTVVKKEITIGDNVWIGWGSIVLKGVTIGDNSIIAAGSVVTGSIPANVVAGGNPARILRKL